MSDFSNLPCLHVLLVTAAATTPEDDVVPALERTQCGGPRDQSPLCLKRVVVDGSNPEDLMRTAID